MNNSVYLRPLTINDAKISYKWRNNPLVWQFTEFKPSQHITEAIETAWLTEALKIKSDYRFAICLKENGKYLGNIQLINSKHKSACLHLFIGDPLFWGKGIGKEATALLLEYGFNKLGLHCITLGVNKKNISAQCIYKKAGFQSFNNNGAFINMFITKKHYNKLHGKFYEENNSRQTETSM